MGKDLKLCERFEGAFKLLGQRWNGLIIDMLLQRPARYCELSRAMPGISDRVLSQRLNSLQQAGLVERDVRPGPPVEVTYALTSEGESLRPVMDAIHKWAESHPAA